MGKTKRFLAGILAACYCFCSDGVVMAANTVIPQTDSENVIKISSVKKLIKVADDLAGNYCLTKDLDLSGVEWESLGSKEEPFTGTFDGNGHVISHMEVRSADEKDSYMGLFGVTNEAQVTNLALENVSFAGDGMEEIYIGTIAGKMTNGIVENCYVSGDIILENAGVYTIGGLVGAVFQDYYASDVKCHVSDCITDVKIKADGNGNGEVGELAGYIQNEYLLKNCYS